MQEETVAKKLARIRREARYNSGDDLQYRVPVTETKEADVLHPSLLRLSSHDYIREYAWIAEARQADQVAAVLVAGKAGRHRLFVYPKGRRRFTLGAFKRMAQLGAKLNGLVAVRLVEASEDLEVLAQELIELAERDADEGSTADPEEWFKSNAGKNLDWLPGFGDSHCHGRMDRWFSELRQIDPVMRSDIECYQAYLSSVSGVVLAHRTGLAEKLDALHGRQHPECRACLKANRYAYRIPQDKLSADIVTDTEWRGWVEFHKQFPEATGLTMLSVPGYTEDGTAFFSAFNRVDPRLRDYSNQEASTNHYIEWVWLEHDGRTWNVTKTYKLNSSPLDGEGPGAVFQRAEVRRDILDLVAQNSDVECSTTLRFLPSLTRPVLGENCVITETELRVGERVFLIADINSLEILEGNSVRLTLKREMFEFQFEEKSSEFGEELIRIFEWYRLR